MSTSLPCSNPLFLWLFTTEKELKKTTQLVVWENTRRASIWGCAKGRRGSGLFSTSYSGLLMWPAGSWEERLCYCATWAAENCVFLEMLNPCLLGVTNQNLAHISILHSVTLTFLLLRCIAFQNYTLALVKLLLDRIGHSVGKSFSLYYSHDLTYIHV